jgi:hypothetical protein
MAELTICRKQRCPCGGEFSFFQSGTENSPILWHRDTDAYETRRSFRPEFFERAGGLAVARDFVAARLNETHADYQLTTVDGKPVSGTDVWQVPETIPREGRPQPPVLALSGKTGLRDSCGCGGALGYGYDAVRDGYVFRHENPGKTLTRETFLGSAYLDQRGRTPMTALMALVERWHAEDREQQGREEGEAMLAQQRDPRNWPSIIGKRVVVTGTLERYDRKGIARAIADAGGYHEDRITPSTNLLVTGVRPGAIKVRDAKAYGIPTIGDRDFMVLLALSTSARAQKQEYRPPAVAVAEQDAAAFVKASGGATWRNPGQDAARTFTIETDRRYALGDVVSAGKNQEGVVLAVEAYLTTDGSTRYTLTVAPAATVKYETVAQATRMKVPGPAQPARRNPTFEELLERERYLRGDRD